MATDATAASTQKLLDKEREKHRASKRAAKLAADQPVPDISVEEAWANLPPETRERFEQVARKGGK